MNASMAQYAQQIAAQFPEIVLSINSQVNDTGLVGGLAFSAYTCMRPPPAFSLSRSFFFRFLSFSGRIPLIPHVAHHACCTTRRVWSSLTHLISPLFVVVVVVVLRTHLQGSAGVSSCPCPRVSSTSPATLVPRGTGVMALHCAVLGRMKTGVDAIRRGVVSSWPVMPRTGGELFIHAKASRRDVLYSLVTTFVDYLGDSVPTHFPPTSLGLCRVDSHQCLRMWVWVRARRSWTTST